jgi:uracil-DNA glycosylase
VGSLKRIYPFLDKYYGKDFLSNVSQSNYCFFRSKTENQIEEPDIERCRSIFTELIEILAPSSILCLSAKLRKHLIDTNQVHALQEKAINFKRGAAEIEFVAVRGKLASGVDIKFLPHPNYPMKRDARSEAWQFCCGPQ